MRTVVIIALKEIQEGMRNRWVLATTLLLAALALSLTFLGSAPTGNVGAGRLDVVVVSLSSLSIGIVTRTLAHLRSDFPGITVSMREDFNDALVDLVASGDTDLTVCSEIGGTQGLSFDYLFDDELVIVMRRDHPLARHKTLRWPQLADEALVLTARGTATRLHVENALAAHGIGKPLDYEVASTPTALAMVRAGFGSTFVSRVALLDLDITGMRTARFDNPPLRRMGIYRRSDRTPSPASMKFAELLRVETGRTLRLLA